MFAGRRRSIGHPVVVLLLAWGAGGFESRFTSVEGSRAPVSSSRASRVAPACLLWDMITCGRMLGRKTNPFEIGWWWMVLADPCADVVMW